MCKIWGAYLCLYFGSATLALIYADQQWDACYAKVSREGIQAYPNGTIMASPWGLSTPRAPKEFFQHFKKVIWSRNNCFSYGFALYFA